MSSTLTNIQHILEARVNAGEDLAVATPFTAMYTRQTPMVDFGAEQVDIEMYKGNRKMAPLVSRLIPGSDADLPVIRPGVAGANAYLYALASQKLEVPSSVLNKRIPGESAFVRGTDAQIKQMRRQFHMVNTAIDATRRILTRNEYLAGQSFFTSHMPIGDTFQSNAYLDFPRNSNLKARPVTTSWATAASATPWTDIGNAQKAVKQYSQVDGQNVWMFFMSSTVMDYLRAIYRSQRASDNELAAFNTYNFDPENGVPAEFAFLTQNGMEYNGWLRTSYSNSKVHLFTLPEGYDATADDSGTSYTDWISGATAALTLFNPSYFKAYYGPGILEPPENNVVEAAIGRVGLPQLGDLSGFTIGGSGIPTRSMLLNIYALGQNQGFGATLEHAPIYANVRPDVTATIATTTAT
jgi:hypothetical protein